MLEDAADLGEDRGRTWHVLEHLDQQDGVDAGIFKRNRLGRGDEVDLDETPVRRAFVVERDVLRV